MQVIDNSVAFDKATRRKANRKMRTDGGQPLDLLRLNRKAEADVRLRCKLADLAQAGTPGAAKAKRKLNDTWTNRSTQSLTGFWNPGHA